jgi:pyruvate/2-oxoglutarate/acetoin dehydrogenase E1 component
MSKFKTQRTVARQHFLASFIDEAKDGKTFTVEFIKKDGSNRVMNARLGVKKGTTGTGMAYKPTDRGLLPVYDMQKRAFRMINFDTIIAYTIHGRRIENLAYSDNEIDSQEL